MIMLTSYVWTSLYRSSALFWWCRVLVLRLSTSSILAFSNTLVKNVSRLVSHICLAVSYSFFIDRCSSLYRNSSTILVHRTTVHMWRWLARLGVSYSNENKLGRQSSPPLNSAWYNKQRVIRPRTNQRPKCKIQNETDKNKPSHFKTQCLPVRLIRNAKPWNHLQMCTIVLWTKIVVEFMFLWSGLQREKNSTRQANRYAMRVPANVVFLVVLMFLIFECPIQLLFRIGYQ